ncbi:uncharacterized protein KD926_007129 [Aspergillus affinis]|uniref:uncharacterized protein n=1 Tax=Aspergillus affinis TaxID=1070780 RepID=UPI0022FEBB01|nr:uncharacterized protein KD926_007129 [Aspergillus affinis]KAI9045826.1 hypothetical protein KD926_007129 [Aspergillus affinis]
MAQKRHYFAATFSGLVHELDYFHKDRPIPYLATANTPSSLHWKEALKKLDTPDSDLAECSQGTVIDKERYLVVGIVPHPSLPDVRKPRTMSMSDEHFPLEVVTPVKRDIKRRKPKFYVLLEVEPTIPRYGAFPINPEEIFYFLEYRTDVKSVKERRTQWTEKVRVAAVMPSAEPRRSYSWLSAVQRVAERQLPVSPDGNTRDNSIKFIWEHFLNPMSKTELTSENAEQLAVEILKRWPILQRHNVTGDKLMRLRHGIVESKSAVGWSRAYGFLALGCESSLDSPNLGQLVVGFLDTIDKVRKLGPGKTPRFVKDMVLGSLTAAIDIAKDVQTNSEDTAKILETPAEAELFKLFICQVEDALVNSNTVQQTYASIRDILTDYGHQSGSQHRTIADQMPVFIDILQSTRTALMS